jgi:hypothetical protein
MVWIIKSNKIDNRAPQKKAAPPRARAHDDMAEKRAEERSSQESARAAFPLHN